MILEETRFMGDHLEEKFAHYMNMIMHSAVVYNMIRKMSVLHSYYYLPFYKFMDIYTSVMKSRYRGKGSTGKYVTIERICREYLILASLHVLSLDVLLGVNTLNIMTTKSVSF